MSCDGVLTCQCKPNSTFDNISVREINPLALSIQMDGRVTWASDQATSPIFLFRWELNAQNKIYDYLDARSSQERFIFLQEQSDIIDTSLDDIGSQSGGLFVPFNIASRHGSNFLNGAVDGTALTANTTPVALPDLSATNLQLGYDYNGTIRTFRMWGQDIQNQGLVEATS